MGLKLNMTFSGLRAPSAYLRILWVEGSVEGGYRITWGAYATREARKTDDQAISVFVTKIPWCAKPFEEAYKALRKMKEGGTGPRAIPAAIAAALATAEDVLDKPAKKAPK